MTPSNHPEFEFDWELTLKIDTQKKAIDKEVKITLSELEFAADIAADKRSKIEGAINSHKTIS